jgi:hypothetical protein
MKAIAFCAPHWELVFDKILTIDGYGVKTRGSDLYSYRGPVLCYTTVKDHKGPMRSHLKTDVPRGVVGVALLEDIRELTQPEMNKLFLGYNNIDTKEEFDAAVKAKDSIYPMAFGYFFSRVLRFKQSFIPPQQHLYGPVGEIPLYPEITKQLPVWAKPEPSKPTRAIKRRGVTRR